MRGGSSQNFAEEIQQLTFKIGELRGERGRGFNISKAAMLKGDLSRIPLNRMKSVQISAAPTQEDFNKLQEDVADIHKTLSTILGKTS